MQRYLLFTVTSNSMRLFILHGFLFPYSFHLYILILSGFVSIFFSGDVLTAFVRLYFVYIYKPSQNLCLKSAGTSIQNTHTYELVNVYFFSFLPIFSYPFIEFPEKSNFLCSCLTFQAIADSRQQI